jgi:hypothetical protein
LQKIYGILKPAMPIQVKIMDYNSKRKKLALPEYGRNIQNMIDYLLTIEDRDNRTKQARVVVDVMGNLNPQLRDTAEYKHKLWDHLAIMADFKLDIDYPYEPPKPEILTEKPNRVPYNQHPIRYRHYGRNVELMIRKAADMNDEEKEIFTEQMANFMKKLYLSWNKESVEDDKILSDLEELSKGKLKIDREMQLTDIKTILGKPLKPKNKKKKK